MNIPRLLAGLAAGSIALLASASPAFAWHVVSAEAECLDYSTFITVDLSDSGPGTFTDSLGNSGSFSAEPFVYDAGQTDAGTVTVTVDQVGAEGDQVAEVDVTECQTPPTTTTLPSPTTTIPVTTTTVPPATTTVPPATSSTVVSLPTTPSQSPPTSPPAAELPATGSTLLALALIGTCGAGLGLLLVAANRRANRKALGS